MDLSEWIAIEDNVAFLMADSDTREVLVEVARLPEVSA